MLKSQDSSKGIQHFPFMVQVISDPIRSMTLIDQPVEKQHIEEKIDAARSRYLKRRLAVKQKKCLMSQ